MLLVNAFSVQPCLSQAVQETVADDHLANREGGSPPPQIASIWFSLGEGSNRTPVKGV